MKDGYTYLAILVVIMSATEEKLKRLLVAQDGSPCKRGVAFAVRIWIAHLGTLDQSFDEKQVVLCGGRMSAVCG